MSVHQKSLRTRLLIKCAIAGAVPAFLFIAIFLATSDAPDAGWGKYWMIRPVLVVTAAGTAGGVFYYLLERYRARGGWWKLAANLLSGLVYLVGLWLGIVLGLDGTMWN